MQALHSLGSQVIEQARVDMPIVEIEAYHRDGLVEAEDLYLDVLWILQDAVDNQTVTEAGYIHSMNENAGMAQTRPFSEDVWLLQGLVQFGIRPPRNKE